MNFKKNINKTKVIHMPDIEVSIVIPTYNRKDSLMETVSSVCNQTFSKDKYEIIVCDDNSTDGTEEVVNELIRKSTNNLRYIKVKSDIKGPAKVRNAGIMNATGMIIGFTDDDCVVSKNWIESAVQCFKKEIGIVGVSGAVLTNGKCKQKFKIPRYVNVSEDEGSYVTSNIFYKKEVLLAAGGFDKEFRYLEDIELGWRIRKIGKIAFNPQMLVYHKLLCLSLKEYFKRRQFIEYWVLMYRKHPEHKKEDNFYFGHIYNKSVFFIAFSIVSIIIYPLNHDFSYLFIVIALLTYFWAHVLIDAKLLKYPFRILRFPLTFITDLIRFIYSLQASIKLRYLVLF